MQRSLITELKQDVFIPFIESLKTAHLNETDIIRITFRFLQQRYSSSKIINIFFHDGNALDFLNDFEQAIMNEKLKNTLDDHPNFKKQFIFLAKLYLDVNVQKEKFGEFESEEIQTCLRELFHQYINPLPIMKVNAYDTATITNKNQIKNNGYLFLQPDGVRKIIYSYLDNESIFSLKRTCKSAYFLHKRVQDTKNHFLYFIANDVQITRPRRFFEFDLEISLNNVSQEELLTSLHHTSYHVKAFYSLYHALEYIHHLQHGGHLTLGDDDEGFIPSLWMGAYIGYAQQLNFAKEKITIDEGCSASSYDHNQREALVYHTTIAKNELQPLHGIAVYTQSNFAQYHILGLLDHKKHQMEHLESNNKCVMM